MATLHQFTNETRLKNRSPQQDQFLDFKDQRLDQSEAFAQIFTAALQRIKQMKGPIEVLGEVHEAGKEHPGLYDSIKVNDRVVVAAIVALSKQLEDFKQSKQDKISPAQVQAMSNELTRGALITKLSRVLGDAGASGNEKDVALRIYQFLESLKDEYVGDRQ